MHLDFVLGSLFLWSLEQVKQKLTKSAEDLERDAGSPQWKQNQWSKVLLVNKVTSSWGVRVHVIYKFVSDCQGGSQAEWTGRTQVADRGACATPDDVCQLRYWVILYINDLMIAKHKWSNDLQTYINICHIIIYIHIMDRDPILFLGMKLAQGNAEVLLWASVEPQACVDQEVKHRPWWIVNDSDALDFWWVWTQTSRWPNIQPILVAWS